VNECDWALCIGARTNMISLMNEIAMNEFD